MLASVESDVVYFFSLLARYYMSRLSQLYPLSHNVLCPHPIFAAFKPRTPSEFPHSPQPKLLVGNRSAFPSRALPPIALQQMISTAAWRPRGEDLHAVAAAGAEVGGPRAVAPAPQAHRLACVHEARPSARRAPSDVRLAARGNDARARAARRRLARVDARRVR
jgi:hypothetical protein